MDKVSEFRKSKRKNLYLVVAVALSSVMLSQTVAAEGFLAGTLRDLGVIDEEQRRALDGAHAAMGNPLDHAANATANFYAPGSVQAYQRFRNMRNRPAPRYYAPPRPQPYYYRPYYGR